MAQWDDFPQPAIVADTSLEERVLAVDKLIQGGPDRFVQVVELLQSLGPATVEGFLRGAQWAPNASTFFPNAVRLELNRIGLAGASALASTIAVAVMGAVPRRDWTPLMTARWQDRAGALSLRGRFPPELFEYLAALELDALQLDDPYSVEGIGDLVGTLSGLRVSGARWPSRSSTRGGVASFHRLAQLKRLSLQLGRWTSGDVDALPHVTELWMCAPTRQTPGHLERLEARKELRTLVLDRVSLGGVQGLKQLRELRATIYLPQQLEFLKALPLVALGLNMEAGASPSLPATVRRLSLTTEERTPLRLAGLPELRSCRISGPMNSITITDSPKLRRLSILAPGLLRVEAAGARCVLTLERGSALATPTVSAGIELRRA